VGDEGLQGFPQAGIEGLPELRRVSSFDRPDQATGGLDGGEAAGCREDQPGPAVGRVRDPLDVAHRLQLVDELAQGGLAHPGAAGQDGQAAAAGIEVGEDGAVLGPEIVALPAEPLEQLHLERLKGAPGFATPAHVHHLEDELFYVLGGALQVTCGDRTWEAGAGALVFLPKGRPHQFVVWEGQPARLLQITAPAQFERFVAEVGVPATRPGLPDPELPDLERLVAAAARHGIDILPPRDG